MLNQLYRTINFRVLLILLVALAAMNHRLEGQTIQNIKEAEDSLVSILADLNNTDNDSLKDLLNHDFYNTLLSALMLPDADDYAFGSLKTLIRISPDDSKFRIYHWNLPANSGKKRYFGFLKLLHRATPEVFPLRDFSDSIPLPDTAILDPNHWFGALYYTAITGTTASGKTYYTLLGWAGSSSIINRKVIEIVSFDEHDHPAFGLPVFPDYEEGNRTRIIFRYAATTSMLLKYEEHIISTEKKWNAKKRDFDARIKRGMMIVCDKLIPLDPQFEGQYQYYVPAGETCDSFQVVDGSWHFVRGVETRNK